jgi:hypothetical protein
MEGLGANGDSMPKDTVARLVGKIDCAGFGELIEPVDAKAIVVFVHGCGGGRHSDHDRFVANYLVEHGYGAAAGCFDIC